LLDSSLCYARRKSGASLLWRQLHAWLTGGMAFMPFLFSLCIICMR